MTRFNSIKLSIFFVLCTITSAAMAQEETKNITISGFSEVYVSTGLEVFIAQGDTEAAKIVATENLIDAVMVEQAGNTLTVKWKNIKSNKKAWLNKSAKVYITCKNLNVIAASEGSSLKLTNILKAEILQATVSSGAIINGVLDCGDLRLQTSSGASAALSGNVIKMKLEASSGSMVNAENLTVNYADVTASAGADVKLNVVKELQAVAESGSNIRYKGDGVLKNYSTSKSGSVKKIG